MKELFPLAGIEKGYFLDIQHFFGEKKLVGFKILCSVCNIQCYYCHRSSFLNKRMPSVTIQELMERLKEWEPFNTVTLTGGEITLVANFAAEVMDILKSRGIAVLFSTNGYYPERVDFLTKHADLVKIDIKGSKKHYKKITGIDFYNIAMESVKICTRRIPTEVKILLHSFTEERDILSVLEDLYIATGFPPQMIIEFQLIKDFLNQSIIEPDADKLRLICSRVRPLPDTVLFKHYGQEEVIQKLANGEWILYRKKEVPLRFDWQSDILKPAN